MTQQGMLWPNHDISGRNVALANQLRACNVCIERVPWYVVVRPGYTLLRQFCVCPFFNFMSGRDGTVKKHVQKGRDGIYFFARRDWTVHMIFHDRTGRYIISSTTGRDGIFFFDGTGSTFLFPRRDEMVRIFFTGPSSGKLPLLISDVISWEMGFFLFPCKYRSRDPIQTVPEEILTSRSHPVPVESSHSPWFPVPVRNILWNSRLPRSRANQNG